MEKNSKQSVDDFIQRVLSIFGDIVLDVITASNFEDKKFINSFLKDYSNL